jgi:hypothetical protein
MKIEEALKETGKAYLPEAEFPNFIYVFVDRDGNHVWMNVDGQHEGLLFDYGSRNDWLPYHEEKEVRPEETGELWVYCVNSYPHFVTKDNRNRLYLTWIDGSRELVSECKHPVIHGKNGWARVSPPVEDKEVANDD